MSWKEESLAVIRPILGDDISPFTYCDSRLLDVMTAVAKLLVSEITFDLNTYSVVCTTQTISPDPSDDLFFIPLLVLKTASVIANSEAKAAATVSGSVSDGPSSVDLSGAATSLKERAKVIAEDYQKAKLQYMVSNAIACQAVMSTCVTIYSDCYDNGRFDYIRYRDCFKAY